MQRKDGVKSSRARARWKSIQTKITSLANIEKHRSHQQIMEDRFNKVVRSSEEKFDPDVKNCYSYVTKMLRVSGYIGDQTFQYYNNLSIDEWRQLPLSGKSLTLGDRPGIKMFVKPTIHHVGIITSPEKKTSFFHIPEKPRLFHKVPYFGVISLESTTDNARSLDVFAAGMRYNRYLAEISSKPREMLDR